MNYQWLIFFNFFIFIDDDVDAVPLNNTLDKIIYDTKATKQGQISRV